MPLPQFAMLAGKAGAAVAPSVLETLMAHPLWGSIFSHMGSRFLGSVLGPELPYGDFAQEQLAAISGALPEIRTQAAGGETAATRAMTEQVRTEGKRFGQSYAQAGRRAGLVGGQPGGTTPYRAQQGRVEAATQAGIIQRRGQAQTQAQQMLTGMAPTAFQHAGIQEMTQKESMDDIMGALGRFNREYQQNQFDPLYQEMVEFLKQYFFQSTSEPTTPSRALGPAR